jgi:hypothetical protein
VTHRRRLEALEVTLGTQSDNPNLCFDCRGHGSYRKEIKLARLRLGAEGKLFGPNPEACHAKLKELANYERPDSEHCPQCGGLNARGPFGASGSTGGWSEPTAACPT